MGNTFGNILKLTTFGESHGPAIGGVLDGCPPGIPIDIRAIRKEMERRRPSAAFFSSKRTEPDKIEILSGVLNGKSTGAPIAFFVRNKDARPEDYRDIAEVFRPSHADYTWQKKYGIRDTSGGGRSSARALLPCVAAGVIADGILKKTGITVMAWVSGIGPHVHEGLKGISRKAIESNPLRCPDKKTAERMMQWLKEVQAAGDTAGGIITCRIESCPAGLGEPVFGKLQAALSHAMMSINSVKGFEYGSGFGAAGMKGSEHNDSFISTDGVIRTLTNHDGGIQGGISNGEDIIFRVAFKPVPSIRIEQRTVNAKGKKAKIKIAGRHDSCVVPRAVPLVEAMTALVIADHWLMQKANSPV